MAFPGVANLGKVAVDSIGNLHEGPSWPVSTDRPSPHAELDEDGLLAAAYTLRSIATRDRPVAHPDRQGPAQRTGPNRPWRLI